MRIDVVKLGNTLFCNTGGRSKSKEAKKKKNCLKPRKYRLDETPKDKSPLLIAKVSFTFHLK